MDKLEQILSISIPAEGALILCFFLAIFITSMFEKEERAAGIALSAALLLSFPYFVLWFFWQSFPTWVHAIFSLIPLLLAMVFFFPVFFQAQQY